jgi:hypothetical protein
MHLDNIREGIVPTLCRSQFIRFESVGVRVRDIEVTIRLVSFLIP